MESRADKPLSKWQNISAILWNDVCIIPLYTAIGIDVWFNWGLFARRISLVFLEHFSFILLRSWMTSLFQISPFVYPASS